MARDVSTLINMLEQDGGIPESSARFSRSDLVAMFNKSMEQQVLPDLFQLNEEYLLNKKLYAFKTGSSFNYPTGFIPLPSRAYGQTIRAISYQSSTETEPHYTIPYVEVREDPVFSRKYYQATSTFPRGWHFKNNGIQILGNNDLIDGTLHVQFYLEPSTLVDSTTLQIPIRNITFSSDTMHVMLLTTDLTGDFLATVPADTNSALFDIIHTPTGSVQTWNKYMTREDGRSWNYTTGGAYTAINISTSTDAEITSSKATELISMISDGLPIVNGSAGGNLSIVPAGRASMTTIPQEWDSLLILDMAKRVWASLGDAEKAGQFAGLYSETHKRLASAFGSRSKGEPKVITNRRGLLEGLRAAQWWGRRSP